MVFSLISMDLKNIILKQKLRIFDYLISII